jgi:HAD superfamily hydrolase (TIGR01509 family)
VQQIVNMLGKERASKIRIFAGDCVPRKKPSPDIYNLAKEVLGIKPDDCVVIEDRCSLALIDQKRWTGPAP